MSGASEYMCVLHRATDQIPPKSSQCTPAAPAAVMSLDPTGSPKEQSKGLRLLRKAALVSGQILSFSDIADFYSDCVPIGTRVYGGGFYGVGGELTIGENETLYIHTVRKNVMAKAEISHNRKYHIPLDFTVPFGILYNPSGNIADARQGFTFESVESILNGKELPKVVRMECNVIDTAGGVVNFGEILIVKGTPAPKQLSVFSISTGNSSTLSKGVFSTDPSLIKMSLQQLHQFAHELLPCQAVLCCEEYPCVPAHLVSSVFTIKEFKSCTTLLVTSQLNTDISMMKVMELPDDLQFQIQITGTDTWPALAKTAKAISDAYPHLTSLYRYLGMPNEKMRQGQLFFYEANVRPATLENEYEVNTSTSMPVDNDYVEVSRPPTAGPLSPVYNVLSHANTNIRGNECQTKQQGNESLAPGSNEYITLFPAAPVYQAVEPLPPQNSNSARQAPQPKKRSQVTGSAVVPVASPQNTVGSPSLTGPPSQQASPSIPKVVPRPRPQSRLKPDMKNSAPEPQPSATTPVKAPPTQANIDTTDADTQLTLQMLRLKQEWADMKSKLNRVLELIPQISSNPGFNFDLSNNSGQHNLSIDEVIALLQSAGLEQYETIFRTEQIDGYVFCELDELTLEVELSITSKLHRLRLMKLIRQQRLLELQL